MKKIISAFMSVVILMSAIASAGVVAEASNKKKYGAIAYEAFQGEEEGHGFLHDLNNDGTNELIIYKELVERSDSDRFFSVYTIKNNKTVKVVKNRKYGSFAGYCPNGVGIAKKNGKSYLMVYTDVGSGDVSTDTYRRVKIKLYKMKGVKLKLVKTVTMSQIADNTVKPIYVKSRSCKINGKKVSYNYYNKWLKSFKYKKVKLRYSASWGYYTFSNNATYLLSLARRLSHF